MAGGGRVSLESFHVLTCLKKSSGVDLGASPLSGVRRSRRLLVRTYAHSRRKNNGTPPLNDTYIQLHKNLLPGDVKDTVPEDDSVPSGGQDEEL